MTNNDNDQSRLYASQDVISIFPWLDKAVSYSTQGTNVMVINISDIENEAPPHLFQNPHEFLNKSTLSTKDDIDFWNSFYRAQDSLVKLMSSHQDPSFIPQNELFQSLIRSQTNINMVTHGITLKALTQEYSATYLPAIMDIETEACLVTVPKSLETPIEKASKISTLPPNLLNNITGNPTDWAIFSIGHELGGHCQKGDHKKYEDDTYHKIKISIPTLDRSQVSETHSDIAGYSLYHQMQSDGIASSANVPIQVMHLRAISNLYDNGNNYNVSNNDDIKWHVTTIGYDPTRRNASSEFNISSMAQISTLPLIINTYSDAIAGFAYSKLIKKSINEGNTSNLNEETILLFEGLSDKPDEIHTQLDKFAKIGANLRNGRPELQYATLKILSDREAFSSIKERLAPEYALALDDLLQDYLTAVDEHAIAIKQDNIVRWVEQNIGDDVNFDAIGNSLLKDHDYPTTPSAAKDAVNILQTLPTQAINPINNTKK